MDRLNAAAMAALIGLGSPERFSVPRTPKKPPTKFVQRQRALETRAQNAMRGTLRYSPMRNPNAAGVAGPYDPFGKVAKAWADWAERRKARNA